MPVDAVEPVRDLVGEVLSPADHERQLAFGIDDRDCGLLLLLKLRHAPLQPCNARFEFSLVDKAPRVAVDEAIDAAPQCSHLTIKPHNLLRQAGCAGCLPEAPPILVCHTARIFQQGSDLIPYHPFEPVAAHSGIAALGRAREPIGIRTAAAIVVAPTF